MRLSTKEDPSKSTRPKRKVGTKLGWSVCSKESFYRQGTDSIRMDENDLPSPINSDAVKKYYA